MRTGSEDGERRAEETTDPAAAKGGSSSHIAARAQAENLTRREHDQPASGALHEQIATIWRLLRSMEVSPEDAAHCCIRAFERAYMRTRASVAHMAAEEAIGGIPIDRVVDPLLAAAFREARSQWLSLLQNPKKDVGASSVRKQGELLVLGLLGCLDEPRRVILLLADMEQLSSPEIAALMGLRLDVVYEELRKARKAFVRARKRLERVGATGDAETQARELLALARTRFSPDPGAHNAVSEQVRALD
jgi:hypothetical protein